MRIDRSIIYNQSKNGHGIIWAEQCAIINLLNVTNMHKLRLQKILEIDC